MDIKKVLAHTCFQIGKGLAKDTPLSPKKCRCRQFVTATAAAAEVELGTAQYVVVIDKIIEVEDTCSICANIDNLKRSCQACGGTGVAKTNRVFVVRGEDIIRTVSEDGRTKTVTTQVKKSPTIEKAHIERAVEGNLEEQARIEAYGASNKDFLMSLISGTEPENNPVTRTGRDYDWGRAPYASTRD